jgi:hypothetical protein
MQLVNYPLLTIKFWILIMLQIGAPPEVIARLDEIREAYEKNSNNVSELFQNHSVDMNINIKNENTSSNAADPATNSNNITNSRSCNNPSALIASYTASSAATSAIGDDPELDEFMVNPATSMLEIYNLTYNMPKSMA